MKELFVILLWLTGFGVVWIYGGLPLAIGVSAIALATRLASVDGFDG